MQAVFNARANFSLNLANANHNCALCLHVACCKPLKIMSVRSERRQVLDPVRKHLNRSATLAQNYHVFFKYTCCCASTILALQLARPKTHQVFDLLAISSRESLIMFHSWLHYWTRFKPGHLENCSMPQLEHWTFFLRKETYMHVICFLGLIVLRSRQICSNI